MSFAAFLKVIYEAVQLDPPMRYTADAYPPDKDVYAPGDTLYFSPTIILGHGGQVDGLRTIMDTSTHKRARLCNGLPSRQYDIHTTLDRGLSGNIMTGGPNVPIAIERLPPGRYKVATNVHGYGDQAGQIGHDVYFRLETPC